MLHSPALREKENSLFRQWTGPLSADLTLHPGDFGLGKVPARLRPDATTRSICGFCSTGCSLDIHLQAGRAVNLTPTVDYPVNLGMACPKGWEALTPLGADDRATTPLWRDPQGKLVPVDWDKALQIFTLRLKAIQDQHGQESIAWIGSGQIVNEELAFLGALGKFGMGMIHGDGNTRQCMATAVTAYKESFGFDAPPYTYRDFEESDVIVLIGSNLCIAHPILWQRVLRNPHRPEIVVIDPRRTETAMAATQHYAIRPKSDLTLFYGLARMLIEHHWIDREFIQKHTTGFDEFARFLGDRQSEGASSPNSEQRTEDGRECDFAPHRVASATGLSAAQLLRLAETIHRGKRVSFWWTMGVNQGHEATRTAQAIINLALMTGNIGRPGTGANSITGQCNAMGSRLFSNTTNLLGGHEFTNAQHREKVARILGMDPARIPTRNSWAYDQILEAIDSGKIKGLWIIGTNTAHSWIHQERGRELLRKLDFLVVQDMYHSTETARQAHLILPAAGWGEKEGTFINSERRLGLVKRISRAPGQALADFHIFKLAAHYWGCGDLFARWTSPEAVFQILKELCREQPCDISGISDYRTLDEAGGVQWPAEDGHASRTKDKGAASGDELSAHGNADAENRDSPAESPHRFASERRLFGDGRFFHADGKARFIFEAPRALPEPVCDEFPFFLLTGRGTSAQWHTQTRTGKSALLRKLYPRSIYVELHPDDAGRLGIKAGDPVRVESRRGRLTANALVSATIQPGHVFIPMHYEATNRLTIASFDPYSRQPAYKACAVAVRRHQP